MIRTIRLAGALAVLALAATTASANEILARAEREFAKGDFAGARKDAEAAFKSKPEEAATLVARLRFAYGDDAGARAALERSSGGQIATALGKLIEGPFAEKLGAERDRFTGRTRGGHYILSTDLGSASAEKKPAKGKKAQSFTEIGGLLEVVYGAYSRAFKGERDKELVSRVFIFSDRERYVGWTKELLGQDPSDAAAYYDPNFRILCVDAEGEGALSDYSRHCMFHEGFHQFLHFYLPSDETPYWFNEGVAEYFGPSDVLPGGKIETGKVEKSDGKHVTMLEEARAKIGGWTPLRELLLLDGHGFMDPDRGFLHYAESWSLVHYLCRSEPGKKMLVRYYDLLREGKSQREAFDQVFARSIDKLEVDVKEYVKGIKPG